MDGRSPDATPPAPDDARRIGERLRIARRAAGLKQSEAAAALGVNRKTLFTWEHGQRLPTTALPKLAALYNRSLSWLISGEEQPSVDVALYRAELKEFRAELTALTAIVEDLAAATEGAVRDVRVFADTVADSFEQTRAILDELRTRLP